MSIEPVRIQLSRKSGFNLQEHSKKLNGLDAVSVARPHKWGNEFKIGCEYVRPKMTPGGGQISGTVTDAAHAVALHKRYTCRESRVQIEAHQELRGKNLACFCALDQPCHADNLLKLANQEAASWKTSPQHSKV